MSRSSRTTRSSTVSSTVNNPVGSTQIGFQKSATKALAQLSEVSGALDPDTDIQPNALKAAYSLMRVPLAAIDIAVKIMQSNPGRFSDFDVAGASDAAAYERAMSQVSTQARKLADDVDISIQKRRRPAVEQTLALYASMKGVARVRGSLHSDIRELRTLVAAHVGKRKPKGTVPTAQQQQAQKQQSQPAAAAAVEATTPPPAGTVTH